MNEVLATYHTLLYLVFTKELHDLGKGVSLTVFDEKPLMEHFIRVFSVSELSRIQRSVYKFLEENIDRLTSYRSRRALLEEFEQNF